ncbi:MAG: preprotein translocase subunit YajC [Lysobacterales bacterium]|jgi:preprotein translocase subunit YajC
MNPENAASGFSFVPFILIFAIFYFLVIRPQQKKQKEQTAMTKNLQKNDKVITTAGIHGTVVIVKEKTVVVRVDDNVRIEFDRDAITKKKEETVSK